MDEAEALRFWDGRGAVRLLAHDPASRALLIERCVPGTPLGTEYGDEALVAAAELMQRLWRAPSVDLPWRRLEIEASRWLEELPARYERHGRPFERALLDGGLEASGRWGRRRRTSSSATRTCTAATSSEPSVSHGSRSTRSRSSLSVRTTRWRSSGRQPAPADVRRALDTLAELLGLDRERMRGWGIAKSLAWDNPDEAQLFAEVGSRR